MWACSLASVSTVALSDRRVLTNAIAGDPLLETLTTRVIRCGKRAPAPPAPAAKGKKAKAVVEEAQPDEWEIELEDTGEQRLARRRPSLTSPRRDSTLPRGRRSAK